MIQTNYIIIDSGSESGPRVGRRSPIGADPGSRPCVNVPVICRLLIVVKLTKCRRSLAPGLPAAETVTRSRRAAPRPRGPSHKIVSPAILARPPFCPQAARWIAPPAPHRDANRSRLTTPQAQCAASAELEPFAAIARSSRGGCAEVPAAPAPCTGGPCSASKLKSVNASWSPGVQPTGGGGLNVVTAICAEARSMSARAP